MDVFLLTLVVNYPPVPASLQRFHEWTFAHQKTWLVFYMFIFKEKELYKR
jgi:hypothetical protein